MSQIEGVSGKSRKEWIDVLRGIAMLIVIYGHEIRSVDSSYIFFVFAGPVEVTLFFAVSGYLFNSNFSFLAFIKRVLLSLIVPWLALSIVPIALISIIKGFEYFRSSLLSIFSGHVAWFMPCCIIGETIFYFINKLTNRRSIIFLLSIAISVIGVFLINVNIFNYLMINRALSIQVFLCLGLFIRLYEGRFDKLKPIHIMLGCILYLFIGVVSIIYFPGESIDIHRGIYYCLPVCVIMIFLGIVLLFVICKKLTKQRNFLSVIGKNTLVCYMWASYPIIIFNAIISFLHLKITDIYLNGAITTIVAVTVCCFLSTLLRRYFPFVLGKALSKKEHIDLLSRSKE